ncbi:MAG: hypothetical protein HC884_01680 [Chloroflexaceae bacterium]|nr:hypothetical protein [Chloroflexaceae bacterium]
MVFSFRIEVYIGALLISGSYDLEHYRRLSVVLNSGLGLQHYVTLRSAIIAPIHRPQQAERVSHLLVSRSQMQVVATLTEPAPPPDYPREEMLTRRDVNRVMFFTPNFGIQANYHKRPDLSLEESLDGTTDDFIALSDAHIYPLEGGQPIVRDFVCLGRAHILAAYLAAHHESI